jgi:chemotaxis protein methyltransferase CheR
MPSYISETASLFLFPVQQTQSPDFYAFQVSPTGGGRTDCPDPLERSTSLRKTQLAAALSQTILCDEPSFFSERRSLDALVDLVLPALIPTRRYTQSLRLWSVGYRAGQETHSLALTIAESCPQLSGWNVELVASGADAAALARAQCGVYSNREVERGLPTELLRRYFEQVPTDGGWQFKNRATAPIVWLPIERLQSNTSIGIVDIAVCHRTLRDLDSNTRRDLLARLTSQLASDGFLILPSSESGYGLEEAFERVSALQSVYRRVRREDSLLSA